MKKPISSIVIGILMVFLINVYNIRADTPGIDYRYYDKIIERNILKSLCDGINDGEECRIPEVLKNRIQGICCDGVCRINISNCDENEPSNMESLIDILKRSLCIGKGENDDCSIRDKGINDRLSKLKGKCCDGKCFFCIDDCDKVYKYRDHYAIPSRMGINDISKSIEILSCIGIQDGDKCQIPKYLVDEFNLFGVCCKGKCNFRKTKCPDGRNWICGNGICESDKGENSNNCPQDCKKEVSDSKISLLITFGFTIIIIFLILLTLMIYRFIRKERINRISITTDYELELKRLNDEKRSIEEMIRLAQIKFHKRKLDEESFREIVRDQQKRLIEIEARIRDLEKRMRKLEKRQ